MEWQILYEIQNWHTAWLDQVMVFITTLGNAGLLWIFLGLGLTLYKKTRWIGIQVLVVLVIGALLGNGLLKNWIQRDRPCWIDDAVKLLIAVPKDYSFPSGHTLASFSSAFVLFFNHKKWGAVALFVAALMGFSRLYLFVHFPSDVLFSIGLGAVIAGSTYDVFKRKKRNNTA